MTISFDVATTPRERIPHLISFFFCLGTEVPRRSAGSDYDRRWWYVSRARAMMHDDAYRARALI